MEENKRWSITADDGMYLNLAGAHHAVTEAVQDRSHRVPFRRIDHLSEIRRAALVGAFATGDPVRKSTIAPARSAGCCSGT